MNLDEPRCSSLLYEFPSAFEDMTAKVASSLGYCCDVNFDFKSRPPRNAPWEKSQGVLLAWPRFAAERRREDPR